MKKIDITLGSSLKAGILCARFNEESARAEISKQKVAIVLEDAINLVSKSLSKPLSEGWELIKKSAWNGTEFVMDYEDATDIGKNIKERFIQNEDVSTFGYKDLKISVDINDKAFKKLNQIQKTFKLSSNFEAARLAISAYCVLKTGEEGGYKFAVTKGAKSKTLKLSA